MTYNKAEGLYRKYPMEEAFEQWIKLDFDGDGVSDYSSPYQLRAELMERQFDFSLEIERMKLGRALYHIAQRRGFKSSKGETIAEQENDKKESADIDSIDVAAAMKKSETKLAGEITGYMEKHGLKTVGQAFAQLEREGQRVRNNPLYKGVRSLYMSEINEIFRFQEGLDPNGSLHEHLLSTKKGIGTIFYKKPLKSQKGNIGKCTLEPNKDRCAVSHPAFERFRALSLLNNIKIKTSADSEWQQLPIKVRDTLYSQLFTSRVKSDFKFKEIREKIEKLMGLRLSAELNTRTINYKDTQSVSGCPVTARLIKLLGEDWETATIDGSKMRTTHGSKSPNTLHRVSYTALDLWNICFNCDDPEEVDEFAAKRLQWDEEKTSALKKLWASISQGYAMLSLKAINNINKMLELGLVYSDAVMMAKVPDITHATPEQMGEIGIAYNEIKQNANSDKLIYSIVNSLIATYKSLSYEERFAHKDYEYTLQESDHKDIEQHIIDNVGAHTWANMDADEQTHIISSVTRLYQQFFADHNRDFYKMPRIEAYMKRTMATMFPNVDAKQWDKLYHHSQISVYKPQGDMSDSDRSNWRLGSPNLGSIKNPVALRTLNVLRRKINAMLDAGMISPTETRVVVETTRSLNDANMRWAIEQYQREREKENNEIKVILTELFAGRDINQTDVDTARYALEQTGNDLFDKNKNFSKLVKKYKLWLEQGFTCMYTGKVINIAQLFADSEVDIEHTVPRSKSFDNSDANLTVCVAHYNRAIKKNHLPTEMPNYEHDAVIDGQTYTAIKPRLEKWIARVEQLKNNVDFWKSQSRRAQTKDRKDQCIRQRHLWQMELDYWRNKLERFKMTEVKQGFRNSQLVDTGVITRHAVMFLKSVFTNVEVQKGSVTADFRKMLGIQELDEKKNRDMHSHHAIDAATLTAIPTAAKRDRMLELYYRLCEAKAGGHDYSAELAVLERERRSCNLGNDAGAIVQFIESHIIVNHHTKDQTFATCHRRARIRGKVVTYRDKDGNTREKWKTGDAIRCRLHEETYCGAIKMPVQEGDGIDAKPVIKDGKFVYDDTLSMVTRVDITSFTKPEDLAGIVDHTLRAQLRNIISQRMSQGMKFTEAIAQDIWLLDKNGNEIKHDKNGRPLRPVRHVRARFKVGRGYFTRKSALDIRSHTHTSTKALVNVENRDYKHRIYAKNDGNYLFLLYEGIKKGQLKRQSRIVNYYEVSLLMKNGLIDGSIEKTVMGSNEYSHMERAGVNYALSAIIKVGTRVIMWNESPDEIKDLSKEELSKRLFVAYKFNYKGADVVFIRSHINNAEVKELVPNAMNCLIEHRDFEITALGDIVLYD